MSFRDKIKELIISILDAAYRQKRIVLALSCLVVFITTYALILPAFTLEKDEALKQGGIEVTSTEDVTDQNEQAEQSHQAEQTTEANTVPDTDKDGDNSKDKDLDNKTDAPNSEKQAEDSKDDQAWKAQYITNRKSKGWTGFKAKAASNAQLGSPEATKTLTPNLKDPSDPNSGCDGTYTLTLSVKAPSSSSQSSNKANIVIVYDSSNSMHEPVEGNEWVRDDQHGTYTLYNGKYYQLASFGTNVRKTFSFVDDNGVTHTLGADQANSGIYCGPKFKPTRTRMDVAQDCVKDLARKLLDNNTASSPDIVELAFIEYASDVTQQRLKTTDLSTFNSWVDQCITKIEETQNGGDLRGGTNWDKALKKADEIDFEDDDPVYIVFISDGNPTARTTPDGITSGTPEDDWAEYDDGKRIGSGGLFGGVIPEVYGTGNSDIKGYNFNAALRRVDVIVNQHGKTLYNIGIFGDADRMINLQPNAGYFDGTDEEHISAAFDDIVGSISSHVGYKDVQVTDGVTSMTSTAIVGHGRASDFTYRLNGEVVTEQQPWMTASFDDPVNDPEHGQYESGRLHWNLGADYILEDGATYSVSFVVWPNQHSYDLVADLNNGIQDFDELTPEEQSQFDYVNGKYVLKTNTVANATFKHSETGAIKDIPLPTPDPMPLTGSETKIEKQWIIDRDPSILYSMLYDTRDDNNDPIAYNIKFDVREDNKHYLNVDLPGGSTVTGDTVEYDWDKYDDSDMVTYEGKSFSTRWEDDLAIATGLMLSEDRMDALGLDKTQYPSGTFGEGADEKRYYILDEGHDYQVHEPDVTFEFDFTAPVFHPMLVDGVLQSVNFTIKDQESNVDKVEFNAMTAEETGVSSLHMENTLRGYIHLKKKVVDSAGVVDTEDKTEFGYVVTLNNAEGPFEGDHIPWYGIDSLFYHDEDGNYYQAAVTNGQLNLTTENGGPYPAQCPNFDPNKITGQTITYTVEGVTKTVEIFGNRMDASNDGKEVTATLKINQDQTLNIANVPSGTTYSISESSSDGFELVGIEASQEGTTQNGSTIEGTIVPNTDNDITYTNRKAVGTIQLTKKVTLDGNPTSTTKVDGDYYFTILDSEGNPAEGKIDGIDIVDGRVKITVTNGQSQAVSITDVPVGTYHIVESKPNNGSALSGIEPADAPNIDLDANTSGDVVVETSESTAVSFTNDKSSATIEKYIDQTVNKKWLDKEGNELPESDTANKTIKYRITQKRAVVQGQGAIYPVTVRLLNYNGTEIKTATYYVKKGASPNITVTKSDSGQETAIAVQIMHGYYNKRIEVSPDVNNSYRRYHFSGFNGISAESLITIRPSSNASKLSDFTFDTSYEANSPEQYIKELDKTGLNYQDYASAEVALSAATESVLFELGEVTYSAENADWTSVISNLPLYKREGNNFYVYKYVVEEIEVDGEPVDSGHYTVETTTSGNTTTIKNTVAEDAPELPAAGGIGTTIFYILGSLLTIGCAVAMISRRRLRKH